MSRELKVESIKTPLGNVPTLKGLETAVNAVIDQMSSVTDTFKSIEQGISHIQDSIENISSSLALVGDNLSEFLVLLSKINSSISDVFQQNIDDKTQVYGDHQANLVELSTLLANILLEFKKSIGQLPQLAGKGP